MSTDTNKKIRHISENSLKNLIPSKPGEIRNPAGRPTKEVCLLGCIKESLAKMADNGQTYEQKIGDALVKQAAAGDPRSVDLMLSYLHSKPVQNVNTNLTGRVIIEVVEDGNEKQ